MNIFSRIFKGVGSKEILKKLDEQFEESKNLSEKLDKYKAALDGEEDWFERVCVEHFDDKNKEIKIGTVTKPSSLNIAT